MAPHFRKMKEQYRTLLVEDTWEASMESMLALPSVASVNALLALLPQGEPLTARAAHILSLHVARITEARTEDGRVFIRRLMWHMNEESGNIGWGIPEAFAACLVAHKGLAVEYHRILVGYIRDTGKPDLFCDHDVLRRSCVLAVGELAKAYTAYRPFACAALQETCVRDTDEVCRSHAKEFLALWCC